ncbi:MAG: hypothetical protein RLY78_120 [Pseudomonadota bacterium]
MMKNDMTGPLRTALLAITTAALSACGGGGSDGGDALPSSGSYAITTASATTLTNDLGASIDVMDAAYSLGFDMATTIADVDATSAGHHGRVSALQVWLKDPQVKRVASASRRIAATSTSTAACGWGGSITVNFADQNNNLVVDGGDSATITFNTCNISADTRVNGTLVVSYNGTTTHNASTGAFSMDATSRFTQLTVTELSSARAVELNGDLKVVSRYTSSTAGEDTVSASSFSAVLRVNGVTNSSRSFEQLNWTMATNSVGTSTSDLSSLISSDLLGGRTVMLTTPVTLRSLSTEDYPSSGQIQLTGANGGRMTITALNATQARRDIDTNGDGTPEASAVLAWTTLLPTD